MSESDKQALQDARAAQDLVEEMAQIGSYEWNLDGSPPVWSRQLYRLLGYQPGEVPASIEAFQRVLHPDDVIEVMATLEKAVAIGQNLPMIYRVQWPNGEIRHVSANSRFERDAEGKPSRMVGTLMDVTDRVLAEESLRTSNATLQAALSLAEIGSWSFDLRNGKLTWSEELYRIHGVSPASFTVTPEAGHALVHPDDRASLLRLHAQVSDGRKSPILYRVTRPTGEIRHVLAHVALVKDASGMPVLLQGAVLDVTERRRLEDLLAQSQRMESIGRLAGGVAHDFNNLLATVMLNASIGRRKAAGHPALENALGEIEAAAARAGELTRQLLAFARRQPVAPRVFAPGEVTRGLAVLLERLVTKEIRLGITAAPDLWRVKADPTQFEQVLINLVVNARDAMPNGGSVDLKLRNVELDLVYVHQHPDARPGGHVLLEVTDTGAGMTPEVLAHVFEPFFTTKPVGEGTGLGLATVYGIVAQAGGHVTVDSKPGQGSRFSVYLPRTSEGLTEPMSARPARGAAGLETVLLAEDDEPVRRATTQVLEGLGYSVIAVPGGAEALALIDKLPVSLAILITDVVMQGMDGLTLAREVRQRRPETRVLLISGYAPPEAASAASAQPDDFPLLAKPFTPTQLAQKIREILDASRP
jgi:two-component system cell cycle sensor histidine kinase/response regulator CckA